MLSSSFVFILILSALMGIITGSFLARIYIKTRIIEYLFFLFYWFFVVYLGIMISLQDELKDNLIYWMALETGFIGFAGSLYTHSIQILKDNLNPRKFKFLQFFGLTYVLVLEILVLFWKKMEQTRGFHILWTEEPHPTFIGSGAGIVINENILYSSAHNVPREIFVVISFILFFLAYWKVQPIYLSPRMKNAHRLWKIASLSGIVFIISQSLWRVVDFNPQDGTIFASISGVVAIIIIVKYPEAFIPTKTQAVRLIELYEIEEMESGSGRRSKLPNEIIVYLQEISVLLKQDDISPKKR